MWQYARRRDFTGGENRLVLPEFMQQNQLILAQNCISTAEGTLETRLGKTQVNDNTLGSGGIISLHRYAKENGSQYLLAQHGTSLYSTSWDGSSAITSFSAVKTGLSGAKLRSAVWKDTLILSDGAANPFYFDGTSCTDLGGTPGAFSIFCIYAGRLWMVPTATPNIVKFSNLEDYDTWDALDIIKIRDADGDVITGLAPQEGGIFVTKNKSVWPIYGTSRHNITVATAPLLDSIGCVAQDCLLDAGILLGQDSLYGFSLNEVMPTGETHRSLIQAITAEEKAASFAQVVPSEQRAIMVLGDGTVLNLDARYKSITSWSGLNIGCMCVADADEDPGTLLIGDADNGFIYSLDNVTDDDGTAIQTIITTPNDDMGAVRKKVWRYFQPELEPKTSLASTIYYRYNVDYSSQFGSVGLDSDFQNILDWGVDNWNEAVWGTATKISDKFWLHGVRGNTISFTISVTDRIKFSGYLTKFREAGAL